MYVSLSVTYVAIYIPSEVVMCIYCIWFALKKQLLSIILSTIGGSKSIIHNRWFLGELKKSIIRR